MQRIQQNMHALFEYCPFSHSKIPMHHIPYPNYFIKSNREIFGDAPPSYLVSIYNKRFQS